MAEEPTKLEKKMAQYEKDMEAKAKEAKLMVRDDGLFSTMMDTAKFNHIQRVAQLYANSKMVPAHFQKDMASVFVVMQMAMRMEVDPFMMLQHTYVVHGRPGFEGKLVIALMNSRGPFTGPVQWRFLDDEGKESSQWFKGANACQAYATHKGTRDICSVTVRAEVAEKEGWFKDKKTKSGGVMVSKWKTMPDLMYRYRSATWLARLFCPEVLMGMRTTDEIEDIGVSGEIIDAQYVEDDVPKGDFGKTEPVSPPPEKPTPSKEKKKPTPAPRPPHQEEKKPPKEKPTPPKKDPPPEETGGDWKATEDEIKDLPIEVIRQQAVKNGMDEETFLSIKADVGIDDGKPASDTEARRKKLIFECRVWFDTMPLV